MIFGTIFILVSSYESCELLEWFDTDVLQVLSSQIKSSHASIAGKSRFLLCLLQVLLILPFFLMLKSSFGRVEQQLEQN